MAAPTQSPRPLERKQSHEDGSRVLQSQLKWPGRDCGPREGQAMKPKRKSYNEEFYELDNLYNEDLRDRYQPMNYNYGWYA